MDIVAVIASKSGLSPDLVKKGLGVVLTGLQKFAPDLYAKVSGFIPNSGEMISAFNAAESSGEGGGLFGSLSGLASKFLGGESGQLAELTGMFSKAGFSADQIQAFAPAALEQLRNVLPADVADQLADAIPGLKDKAE